MGRSSPSPTLFQFSLDQTRRRLWRCDVRKSWHASHQSINRRNGDLLSSCEGTELSSHRLSCILSFLVCLGGSAFFSVCVYLLSCFCLGSVAYYSQKRAGGLCSRTLIYRIVCRVRRLNLFTPVNPATWEDAVVICLGFTVLLSSPISE
jgi:hypothetical protein